MTFLLAAILLSPPAAADFRQAKEEFDKALDGGDEAALLEAIRGLAGTKDPRAVPILVRKGLAHESLGVRQATIGSLQSMDNPDSTKALARELAKAKPERAVVLARALRGHQGDDLRKAAQWALRQRRWEIRLEAVKALAASPEEEGADILQKAAGDDHPRVAYEAAKALEGLTGSWPEKIRKPTKVDLLPDYIPSDRLAVILDASDALRGETGDETILDSIGKRLGGLMDSLPRSSRFNVFSYASRVRTSFEEPSLPRKKAAGELNRFLGRLRPEYGADLWEALSRALKMEDLDTLYLLVAATPVGGRVTDPDEIRRGLEAESFTRNLVIHTVYLPTPGAGGEPVKTLLKEIADVSGGTFRSATLAVKGEEEAGSPPEDTGPPPEEEKKEEEGGFVVKKEKGRISADEWRRVKAAFDEAVEKGEGTPAAAVVEGFAAGDDERTVEWTVRKALFHEDLDIAEAAERGLSLCKDPGSLKTLLRYVRIEGKAERKVVFARLLRHFPGEKVDEELIRYLKEGQPWEVQSAVMEVIEGRRIETALPPLRRLLEGSNPRLAWEAAVILRGMGESVEKYPVPGVSGLFPERIDGANVAFAVDTYETMRSPGEDGKEGEGTGKSRLAIAAEGIRGALGRISPGGRFDIFRYGIRVTSALNGYSPPTTQVQQRAEKFLDRLETDPGGRDTGGLLKHILENEEADTLYILTDGAPEERRGLDLDGLRKETRRLNRARNVRIHVIFIHPEPPAGAVAFYKAIAQDSGGTFLSHP